MPVEPVLAAVSRFSENFPEVYSHLSGSKKFKLLKNKAALLPQHPGVYLMKNKSKKIIYVGKAKRLKNRVSQYFSSYGRQYERVSAMVSQIDDFDYILAQSEFEALVLECNLIKLYLPKYNILLKDDKGFNYVKITNQEWPRIVFSHDKIDDGAQYIGPYLSGMQVRDIIDVVTKLYKIPRCNRDFSAKFTRPCLYYFIDRCMAPCAHKINKQEYLDSIKESVKFIKNGSAKMLNYLNSQMAQASRDLQFEKAAQIRDRINTIKKLSTKQNFVSIKNSDQDFFAFVAHERVICVVIFCFRNKNLFDVKKKLLDFNVDMTEIRTEFVKNYYNFSNFVPQFITIDDKIDDLDILSRWLSEKSGKNIKISYPKKKFEREIVKTLQENAINHLQDCEKGIIFDRAISRKQENVLEKLAGILHLQSFPTRIEAYDISNISGSNNVAGMITLIDGKFVKSEYKKFKTRTVVQQDDYTSLYEICIRRFKNCEEKFSHYPDLILVDGGKGQVAAVKRAIYEIGFKIPVFGMVKNSRHMTDALTDEQRRISIKNFPEVFKFIENIQNEVHRFAIGFHKSLRMKSMTDSELTKIDGIGEKRAVSLLRHFGSLKKFRKRA